jgi:hypothetical protein
MPVKKALAVVLAALGKSFIFMSQNSKNIAHKVMLLLAARDSSPIAMELYAEVN